MKELSIEEKAKAYDRAIKVIKYNLDALNKITETGTEVANIQPIKNWFYRAFPELKESEDEKIKKRIIALVNAHGQGRYKEEMLAWFEKQNKQKPFNYENINIQQNDFTPKSALEAINEEKVDNANKVGLKFNEGEWISGYCTNYKILSVNDNGYLAEDVDGNKINILFENEKFHHLFTIADVKDGDVLKSLSHHLIWIYKDNGHYACVSMNYITKNVYIDDGLIRMPSDACPATKDERITLFENLKKIGYEWDKEKKQLKKIEQKKVIHKELTEFEKAVKQVMEEAIECGDTRNLKADAEMLLSLVQKPAWSEEDEKTLERVIRCIENHGYMNVDDVHWLKSFKDRVQSQPKQEWSEEDKNRFINLISLVKCSKENNATKAGFIEFINKLKSLSLQNTWKPSDEYINALEYFIRSLGESGYSSSYDNKMELLRLLLFDLKKLKE